MTTLFERLLRLTFVQTRDAVNFSASAGLSNWLHDVDFHLGLEVESGMVVATHRASNTTRMIPSTNIIGMAPEVPKPEPPPAPTTELKKRAGRP